MGDYIIQIILTIEALERGVGERSKGTGKELNQKLESGGNFPGGPVEDSVIPPQEEQVRSLVGELILHMVPLGAATN